jgi:hypothetical protein
MKANVLLCRLEKFGHLRLRQPNGFIFHTDINACVAVLSLIDDDFGIARFHN